MKKKKLFTSKWGQDLIPAHRPDPSPDGGETVVFSLLSCSDSFPPSSTDTMQVQRTTWGGLSTVLLRQEGDEEPVRAAIVLCHGFGAPGTDLCGLAPELVEHEPTLGHGVLWVFPAAPLSLDRTGGRAWWPIDMVELQLAVAKGALRNLRNQIPEELPTARSHLLELLDELKATTGLDESQIVLGGFSQGAMVTTDVALRLPAPPAGLCVLSGTLLCESQWRPLAAQRGPMRVFQSHGTYDPLLPFEIAKALRDLFTEHGSAVEFVSFPGEHTIPPAALEKLGGFLARVTT